MKQHNGKYQAYPQFHYPKRQWPEQRIEKAPIWCSVDLRDGNQALINPMNLEQKLHFFDLLVQLGFKEIEVGFPSAAEVEYQFLRTLIDENRIPDDVTVQVLTQAREHLIAKTAEAIDGAKNVILHLYNSTSVAQRKIVFQKDKAEITAIATQGTAWCKQYTQGFKGNLTLEYSPESFTGTETDYALEISEAVREEWHKDNANPNPVIINLPATVELSTPNIYADQIEWFSKHLKNRDQVILSLHTHNDRGTAVAATELALLAGADRVEGTLFGNGERTGNVDIITLALNLYTQGVDPKLNLNELNKIISSSEHCTQIPVHPRHPYAGELVYTAFSGSHQDAIKKGMAHQEQKDSPLWEVPYLPIDPSDLGRDYEAIIRINSQSGKGGVAYILEQEYGCKLPKAMHPEFAKAVQRIADQSGKEVESKELWHCFNAEYCDRSTPYSLEKVSLKQEDSDEVSISLSIKQNMETRVLDGTGNGPIDACKAALKPITGDFQILSYSEHSLEQGSSSKAIAYIQIEKGGKSSFGVGIHSNINTASIRAIFSALNRLS